METFRYERLVEAIDEGGLIDLGGLESPAELGTGINDDDD